MRENPDHVNECGFCKQQNSMVLYPTYDTGGKCYTINACKECRAFFLAPRPTEKELQEAYSPAYYGEKEEKFEGPIEKILDHFRMQRARLVSSFTPSGGKVLDVGCGNGRFLLSLLKCGNYELYGLELPGAAALRAGRIREIKLKTCTLGEAGFSENMFHAVTLFHVFEHLAEPRESLEIIRRITREKGVLVVSFPNIGSTQSSLFRGKWLHLDPPRHLFFFKPRDFVKLVEGSGYELLRQNYFSPEQNPFGLQQSILNCFFTERDLLFEHLKGNERYTGAHKGLSLLLQKLFVMLSLPACVALDALESIFKSGATVEFVFRKI